MALRLPRIIPRIAIKGENVVCTINLEGLRVVGDPAALAKQYAEEGADELFYTDTVASLYGRNQLTDILRRATAEVFIPITVAGGIKTRADAKRLLDAGADAIAINTAALRNPSLINELSDYYGAQAITVSIEAHRQLPRQGAAGQAAQVWECYTDAGRERTGRDVIEWAQEAEARGAGQILLTSIDQEGTRRGFDTELLERVAQLVSVPVVICGGMGSLAHLAGVQGLAHGVAMASVLHYGSLTIAQMRGALGHGDVGISPPACPSLPGRSGGEGEPQQAQHPPAGPADSVRAH